MQTPQIFISIANPNKESNAIGDINITSIGLAFFFAWAFSLLFGIKDLLYLNPTSAQASSLSSIDIQTATTLGFGVYVVFLFLLAITNKKFINFYVKKQAIYIALALILIGTISSMFLASTNNCDLTLVFISTALSMMGASLLTVLWGTVYSKMEFPTVILNGVISVALGIIIYIMLMHWLDTLPACIIIVALPILSVYPLYKLTPPPFYEREEAPIFEHVTINRLAFAFRLGFPALLLGMSLGIISYSTMFYLLISPDATTQFISVAASFVGIAVVLSVVFTSSNEADWTHVMRYLVPIIAISICSMPLVNTNYQLISTLFLVCGLVCFLSLALMFLSNISKTFMVSPIQVFGIGFGFLCLGAFIIILILQITQLSNISSIITHPYCALLVMLALVIGSSLFPRRSELGTITKFEPVQNEEPEPAVEAHAEIPESDKVALSKTFKSVFKISCDEICERYVLTRREKEVMILLAKGYNAAKIQEDLCISKSTAKTHINHIYRKMEIHTQQDLLSLIDAEKQNYIESQKNEKQ